MLITRPAAQEIAQRLVTRDPRIKDIAALYVNGKLFTDWTSVRVESRYSQPFPIFQFECTEETPMPNDWFALQFAPGDHVRVYLGGVLAVVGYIRERHVAFDAKSHAVRLIGTGDTADLVESVVPLEKVDGHNGKNWLQLSQDISSHLGIKIKTNGAVDLKPFQSVGIQPGETIMNVIERYARHRNIVIGSNHDGGLLGQGEMVDTPLGEINEGYHILRANCVIRDENLFGKIWAIDGSRGGSNGSGGSALREQRSVRAGSSTRQAREMGVVTEISGDMHDVNRRADMEVVFTEGTEIQANITVQGWFKDNNKSDALWRANESYIVHSPMLMLNRVRLVCATCVYEQSDAGTTTTLTMVDPIHLNRTNINIRQEALKRQREMVKRYTDDQISDPIRENKPPTPDQGGVGSR
jgi:prophage tail gpP-like protein